MEKVYLTKLAPNCGCAAKVGPGPLAGVLCGLPKFQDPNLLVGTETSDDAAVYRISDELAMIQTLDFFTPVADDPYDFGQIAAANALSDVYAMGGEPKTALNIVAFPKNMDTAILGEILKGGADKVMEAGAVLAGGHTIQDDTPKYGLSVTGFVHPEKFWKNYGAQTVSDRGDPGGFKVTAVCRSGVSELKIPYDTVMAADFADAVVTA